MAIFADLLGRFEKHKKPVYEDKKDVGPSKTYDISFTMVCDSDCVITPKQMLEKDKEDGGELGFQISNIKVTKK